MNSIAVINKHRVHRRQPGDDGLDAGFAEAYVGKAVTTAELRGDRDGINDYCTAITIDPENALAYFNDACRITGSLVFGKKISRLPLAIISVFRTTCAFALRMRSLTSRMPWKARNRREIGVSKGILSVGFDRFISLAGDNDFASHCLRHQCIYSVFPTPSSGR